MSEKVYDVPPEWKKRAYIDADKYKEMYARSLKDPNGFWAEEAKRLHWYKAPTKIKNSSFGPGNVSIKWFEDGVLNAAYNCIDRHLSKRAKQTAIICNTAKSYAVTCKGPNGISVGTPGEMVRLSTRTVVPT